MIDTKALREKVLDLAIRGNLVPQDPNDEPASVLLERIRAQKQQMVKEGKLKAKDIKNDTIIFKGDDNLHYEKCADGTVKCIEDEIPFEIPEGWEWARANCVIDVRDGTHDTPAYIENGVPLIMSKNLIPTGIDYSNVKYISHDDAIQINLRSGVDVGDILFAMIGTIGNPKLVTDNTLISIKNLALFKFSYSCDMSHQYITNVFEYFQDEMRANPSGGLQPFVSLNRLKNYLLPIPPVSEQIRISNFVWEVNDYVETIITEKNSLIKLINIAKSKILDLATRGKLVPQDPNDEPASVLLERIRAEKEELIKQGKIKRDKKESVIIKGEDNSYYEKMGDITVCIDEKLPFEIPDNWTWGRGFSCFAGMNSNNPKDEFFEYIDIDSIDNKNHRVIHPKKIATKDSPSRAKRAVQNGSVVFSLVRPYLENIAFINEALKSCIASTGFYICNSNGVFFPEFMFYLMTSNYVISGLNQFMKGDNSPSISKENVENWLYPIPPYNEQKRLVKYIRTVQTYIQNMEASLN